MQNLQVQPDKQNDSGPCDCCGAMSRTVWGYLYESGVARAVYYVQWTLGQVPKHGANVDLVMGEWSDASTPEQRVAVSLELRRGETGVVVTTLDPDGRPHAQSGLAAHLIPGRNVLGNPVAADAHAFTHAIFGQDARLAEVIQGLVG